VPPNTETAAVNPRAGIASTPGGVCSLLSWPGPGASERSRPSIFVEARPSRGRHSPGPGSIERHVCGLLSAKVNYQAIAAPTGWKGKGEIVLRVMIAERQIV
jgi:hypothetical protein